MSKTLRMSAVLLLTALLSSVLVGCGEASDRTQAATVFVVATATSNEPSAALPADFDEVLRAANASHRGQLTLLVPRGGRVEQVGDEIAVKVMRDASQPENDAGLIAKGLDEIAREVHGRVSEVASNEPTLDVLTGIADASRRADRSTLIVISSGLATTGLTDFTRLGWDFDDAAVVGNLRSQGFVPDLSGKKVLFVGLGETAGAQQPLPAPMRAKVESLWLAICTAGGAQECATSPLAETAPPAATTPARTVEVPRFELPDLPRTGTVELAVPNQALFAPDSAAMLAGAERQLAGLASELIARNAVIDLVGHTWSVGAADGARALSLQRATAVADALARQGFPRASIKDVRGVGFDEPIAVPGADEQQTAAANRVVVITIRTAA